MIRPMDEDELLDLVDANDHVISTILRSQTSALNGKGFLRAAEAFIQNSDGKLWIPRRQLNKRIAPGGLDYSMGEHVKAGEDYLSGCIRGFAEELNIRIKPKDIEFIKTFRPIRGLCYFRALYIYKSDEIPAYNTDDFTEYYWLTPKGLVDKLNTGEPAKNSLIETATYLLNR